MPPIPYISPLAHIGDWPESRVWHDAERLRRHSGSDAHQHEGTFVHPEARVEALATVDAGAFRPTQILRGAWLMKRVHIGHDAIIGAGCELAPGTVVAGECEVGDFVKMGVNSCTVPRVKIGDRAVIGAGAVVTKDVPAGETWVGNPARPLVKSGEGRGKVAQSRIPFFGVKR